MARGWESKAVESQIEAVREEPRGNSRLTDKQQALQREREGLAMARSNVLHQIDSSSNERYRELLRETLKELDAKIAKITPAA